VTEVNSTSGPGTTPNEASEVVAGPTVFISHASQDHAVAEEICRLLEEDGIRCGETAGGNVASAELYKP
jgi:hypothetical protein